MRWPKLPTAKVEIKKGEKRKVRMFIWWPTTLLATPAVYGGKHSFERTGSMFWYGEQFLQTRWLEFSWIEQEYNGKEWLDKKWDGYTFD